MFKDILVPYVDKRSEGAPLTVALTLAERYESHVVLLVIVDAPAPIPNDWAGITYSTYLRLYEEAHARAKTLAEALRARVANAAAPVEVRIAEALALYPASTASLHAHYADLAIVPTMATDGDSHETHDIFQYLLLDSGRPVLAVPPGSTAMLPPKRVTIAWQPTREASRAVHDALPILQAADTVEVLVIDPKVSESAHGQEPGADIAKHLARHGVKVEVETRPSMGSSVGVAIIEHAHRTGSDLIVAGGYGHSRFREMVLGGATRDMLHSVAVPVLFSH